MVMLAQLTQVAEEVVVLMEYHQMVMLVDQV
jgi:hypothetical protein